MPAYQEGGVIGTTVGRLRSELSARIDPAGLEVIVADDGSTDATAAEAEGAGADRVLRLAHRGKGSAVRAGMLGASGEAVVFCDADLAYAPDQVLRLWEAVEAGADVAAGSRRHEDAVTMVRTSRLRELSTRAFSLLIDAVVVGGRHDTQCGIKGFNHSAAQSIFSRARVDGFAFDVEVFALAHRLDLKVVDVPVQLTNSSRSSVRMLRDATVMLRDVARVRLALTRGAYGPFR